MSKCENVHLFYKYPFHTSIMREVIGDTKVTIEIVYFRKYSLMFIVYCGQGTVLGAGSGVGE